MAGKAGGKAAAVVFRPNTGSNIEVAKL